VAEGMAGVVTIYRRACSLRRRSGDLASAPVAGCGIPPLLAGRRMGSSAWCRCDHATALPQHRELRFWRAGGCAVGRSRGEERKPRRRKILVGGRDRRSNPQLNLLQGTPLAYLLLDTRGLLG
jgi:hypothetical protein